MLYPLVDHELHYKVILFYILVHIIILKQFSKKKIDQESLSKMYNISIESDNIKFYSNKTNVKSYC